MLDRNKFKGAVARAGMTQNALAKRLEISNNTLSSRVTGKSSFSVDEVDSICKILKIEDAGEKAEIFLAQASQK